MTPHEMFNAAETHQASFAATTGSALLPCPFCGGTAESDTMQGFRRMKDGAVSNAVAIYCTKCSATITMCHEDHPEYFPSTLLEILREAWNVRVPNKDSATPVS